MKYANSFVGFCIRYTISLVKDQRAEFALLVVSVDLNQTREFFSVPLVSFSLKSAFFWTQNRLKLTSRSRANFDYRYETALVCFVNFFLTTVIKFNQIYV